MTDYKKDELSNSEKDVYQQAEKKIDSKIDGNLKEFDKNFQKNLHMFQDERFMKDKHQPDQKYNEDKEMSQRVLKLFPDDILLLTNSKNNKQAALARAQLAVEQSKSADLAYEYHVLQIYRKYGLSDQDTIDENWNVVVKGVNK
jgi:GAF domain-containing protein